MLEELETAPLSLALLQAAHTEGRDWATSEVILETCATQAIWAGVSVRVAARREELHPWLLPPDAI